MKNQGPILTYVDQPEKKIHNYVLTIPYEDVANLELGPVDKKVIEGCKASNSIADKILGVHLMLTRIIAAREEKKQKEAKLPKLFVPSEFNKKEESNGHNPLEQIASGAERTTIATEGSERCSSGRSECSHENNNFTNSGKVHDQGSTGADERSSNGADSGNQATDNQQKPKQ